MPEEYKFIFDMDGTLYQFNNSPSFKGSRFEAAIKERVYALFMERYKLSQLEAVWEYERIKQKYNGEISHGVEGEWGLDRYEYFETVWKFDPSEYINRDTGLSAILEPLKGRAALLTSAPSMWAKSVLSHLGVEAVFGSSVYTGEPELRKPNPLIFQKIARDFQVSNDRFFSIGDQEHSDIVPAKSIGMKTLIIGGNSGTIADYSSPNIRSAISLLQKLGHI